MRRAALLGVALLAACDLPAAALDYQSRYCMAFTCDSPADGGGVVGADGGTDGGADGGTDGGTDAGCVTCAPTALFRSPNTTFLVLRLETQPASDGGATDTYLEERQLADGALVASEVLSPLGLRQTTTGQFHGGLSRAGDGRSVVTVLYDGSRRVNDTVSDTIVRRVLVVRRTGLDWSTAISDAFPQEQVFSVATHDGTTFWVSGNARSGNGSALHEVALGSAGTSRFVARADPFMTFLSVTSGRLLSARYLSVDGGPPSGIDDVASAMPPLAGPVPTRLVSLSGQQRAIGFAALDLNAAVPGPDVLYVPSTINGLGLRKFVFDGTRWTQEWAVRSVTPQSPRPDGCLHVAARPEDGGVVVLCTAENFNAREVVRFDDFGVGDAGPTPRLLARIEGDGSDGGVSTIFRGIAFSPD